MWFALAMILLFVGYCWLDSFKLPLLEGSEGSNASDDDTESALQYPQNPHES